MNKTVTQTVEKREGLISRTGNFFKGVVSELKKVVWPTKKELISYEVAVIVFSLIGAVSIWVFDIAFRTAITALLKL